MATIVSSHPIADAVASAPAHAADAATDITAKKRRRNAHAEIMAEIVAMIKKTDLLPWERDWTPRNGQQPCNVVSGKPYQGFNMRLLSYLRSTRGYESNYWVTLNQIAKHTGAALKSRDEKPAHIIKFVSWNPATGELWGSIPRPGDTIKVRDRDGFRSERTVASDEKWVTFPRATYVYNISQTVGMENVKRVREERAKLEAERAMTTAVAPPLTLREKFDAFDETLTAYRTDLGNFQGTDPVPLVHIVNAIPHCKFQNDFSEVARIVMPDISQYTNEADYWRTLAHEHVHSTGIPNGRKLQGYYGDGNKDYSFEELVAEIGANFLIDRAGFRDAVTNKENSAAYIKGWVERLSGDPSLLYFASRHATKAETAIFDGIKIYQNVGEKQDRVTVSRPDVEVVVEPTSESEGIAPAIAPSNSELPPIDDPVTAITIEFIELDETGSQVGESQEVTFANSTGIVNDAVFTQLVDFSADSEDLGVFNASAIHIAGVNPKAYAYQFTGRMEETMSSKLDGRDITDFIGEFNMLKEAGWKLGGGEVKAEEPPLGVAQLTVAPESSGRHVSV
jgi:antirestriction protein ArdC